MSSNVIVITDSDFEAEVLKSDKTVLTYFWASWCGPCKLVAPSVEKVATEYSDRLKVVKMDVDPNPDTVKLYKVEGIPALRLFRGEQLLLSHEGSITKTKLVEMLEPHLS
ncbi:MAG: thioredoxin [Trichodesmium sp. St16_bin2-tuft]|nr:thioredoxin [Trichodesmium sp. St5_bin2_1]MDE5081854.1 thioredoxin [Trichodesmium sp. St18_bin1]MDE5089581.1 thioredoxin [Trichodesmium sp. St16_bin2-tuft]MDE5117873.1 thioredoxin [Trichodesmium sp. St2_bin2_1]MDE5122712.1 thioredoxin [Trichodesmium sp. St19_bin1]